MSDAVTHEADPAEAPVRFAERSGPGGRYRIGIATLNAPKTLNGLSLEMARLLDARLQAWAGDDGIAMVVLEGTGGKAFCAGGDLHALYRSMKANDAYAAEFFALEYRLDYRIHTYAKPILCWGHGVVMGGGIGLMAGASHRVVTERSRVAFPEITIGLYPDVGGSYLLHRAPGRTGLFLALTGAPLNAGDAIHVGLADVLMPADSREAVGDALLATAWAADPGERGAQLDALLATFAMEPESGPLQAHAKAIDIACAGDDLEAIVARIEGMTGDDAWLATAKATLAAGAPGSARLAFEAQRRALGRSLAEVFRMEYVMSLACAAHGDFAEGIRALLIDKDRQPRWHPAQLAECTAAWADLFFTMSFPPADHPLRDLG